MYYALSFSIKGFFKKFRKNTELANTITYRIFITRFKYGHNATYFPEVCKGALDQRFG